MLQPKKKVLGSKVKNLKNKIKSVKTEKTNLQSAIRKMSKEGHRGDFGQVKSLSKMDSIIKKRKAKLKKIKGSGGGTITNSNPTITNRYQKFINSAARAKNKK